MLSRQPIKVCLIVLALASLFPSGAARADFSAVGDWVAGGSFYQGFQYDGVAVDMVSALNTQGRFEPPAIRNLFAAPTDDWTSVDSVPGLVSTASGTAATHVDFKLWFSPNAPTNEVVTFAVFEPGMSSALEIVDATFNGSAWGFGATEFWSVTRDASGGVIFTPVVPVPVPGAALLGIAGLGMVGFVRRRFS